MQEIVLFNILSGVELPYLLQRESQRLSNFFNRPVHFFTTRTFFCCCCVKEAMNSMCFTVKPHCTITSRKRPLIQNTQIFLVKAFLVITSCKRPRLVSDRDHF